MSSLVSKRRAVAPIIAHLLMVAIAVVGGILIFVFTQGFFSDSQVSSSPNIETVAIIGYDARDIDNLECDNETALTATANTADNGKIDSGDTLAIYVRNGSANDVIIDSLKFGGAAMTYGAVAAVATEDAVDASEFAIMALACDVPQADTLATLDAGQTTTIVLGAPRDMKNGGEAQVNIQTANGNTFLGTVLIGTKS